MSYATEALAIAGKSLIITLAVGATTVGAVGIIVPEWQKMVEGPSSNPDKGAACKRAKQLYLAVTGAEDSKAVRCVGSSVQDATTGPKSCNRNNGTYYKTGMSKHTCDLTFTSCIEAKSDDSDCDAGVYAPGSANSGKWEDEDAAFKKLITDNQ